MTKSSVELFVKLFISPVYFVIPSMWNYVASFTGLFAVGFNCWYFSLIYSWGSVSFSLHFWNLNVLQQMKEHNAKTWGL
jgi:hypothetical protein